ncbi:MAG: cell surface protein [Armatimonadota bacterium]
MKFYIAIPALLVLILICIPFLLGAGPLISKYPSPLAIAVTSDGATVYVAESGLKLVDAVNVSTGKITRSIRLTQNPLGLALSAGSKTLYVTGDGPQGKLFTVDLKRGEVIRTLALGHTPMSPVIDTKKHIMYLCNRYNDQIAVVDLIRRQVTARIQVNRQPIACELSPDGSLLFAANHLPVGPSNQGSIASEVQVIDTKTLKVIRSISLPNGSSSLRGLAVSPDGLHVYVTHILSRYSMPTTQLERGWMNTNALSIIDAKGLKLLNTVLLDDIARGAANPWAVDCSADGKIICVTHAGTHEVSIIDRWGLHKKLDLAARKALPEASSLTSESIPDTLSFLGNLRQRYALSIRGPRSCVIAGSKLIVSGYFSDNLEIVDLKKAGSSKGRVISLGDKHIMSDARRGEMLFNDAGICFQQWQSCASCHPDGRIDGLNWDLMNDSLGNPKNTKSMLLSHMTPPVMSLGVRKNAETAVRAGIKFIQFADAPEKDARAIDTYLKSMQPVVSPYLNNGKLSDSAKRGEIVFKQAECASCHSGPLQTDLKGYNLGTGTGIDSDVPVDNPTLIEVWRTAPYMHDGRAVDIMDVLTKSNPDDIHGKTSHLSTSQLHDLEEYIMSQ